MSSQPYYLAPPCPNCGQEDEAGAYKGARRGSTAWGHSHSCCSEACGVAFRESPKRAELEIRILDQRILGLSQARKEWEAELARLRAAAGKDVERG